MGREIRQVGSIWELAAGQHDLLARRQLVDYGVNDDAIGHRVATRRLYRTPFQGVYAVGRKDLSDLARFMAAVLACGEGAALSHQSAAELWGMIDVSSGRVHVSVRGSSRSRGELIVHRRSAALATTSIKEIPV